MKQIYFPYWDWECFKHGFYSSPQWIMKHIGMDKDEILRLKQITGLTSLFKDIEFTKCSELG